MLIRQNDRLMLSDKAYAVGKRLVQVIIPALTSLYFGLGNIWNFPNIEKVIGTSACVITFLGICLGISSKQYDASDGNYGGDVVITNPEGGPKNFSLELSTPPEDLENKDSVTFKIKKV